MFNDPNTNPNLDPHMGQAMGNPLMGQQFMEGAPVFDINGEKVGDVSEHLVQQGKLVIHRGLLKKDVYLPLNTITRNDPNGVYLSIGKDEVKDLEDVGPMPESQRRGAMGTGQQPIDQEMGTPDMDVNARDMSNRDMPEWADVADMDMGDRDMIDRP